MHRAVGTLSLLAALGWVSAASAALTDSEKAQIAGFVKAGDARRAARVRALVARPDLSAEEAAEPLIAGYREVTFDPARAAFTRELLFGPGSDAARSTLVKAVVRALLARAGRALAALPAAGGAAGDARAEMSAAEIVRIHAFVSEHVANADQRVRDDALKDAAEAYQKHLEQHAKWLRHGAALGGSLVRIRAQAQLTTVDLSRDLFAKREVAGWLGLAGARRAAFERRGVLIEDGGNGSEARLETALRLLEVSERAAAATDLWLIHKAPIAGLVSRRPILRARTALGTAPLASEPQRFWSEEVEPAKSDARLAEVAYAVAWQATRVAFEKEPKLREIAARVAEASAGAGRAAYLATDLVDARIGPDGMPEGLVGASPELVTAHALRLVLLDAPRATTLAVVRSLGGRHEPAQQLALALGVLARGSDRPPTALVVGRTAEDGGVELVTASDVKHEGPLVRAFVLGTQKLDLGVSADGSVTKLTVDGKQPKLAKLPLARVVPAAAETWTAGGIEWQRITGAPRGLALDDGRFVLASAPRSNGFDAVATGKTAEDARVRATIRPSGAGGGILLRADEGESSYAGVALLLRAEPARAELVLVDGKGKAVELAPAIDLPPAKADGWEVAISVAKDRVSASVGGKKIAARLSIAPHGGRVGLTVRAGGRIEVKAVSGPTVVARTPTKK